MTFEFVDFRCYSMVLHSCVILVYKINCIFLSLLCSNARAFTKQIFINDKTLTDATHYSCMATTVTSNLNEQMMSHTNQTATIKTNNTQSICTINIFLIKEISGSGVCGCVYLMFVFRPELPLLV